MKVKKLTLVASPGIEPGFWAPETHALSIVLRGQKSSSSRALKEKDYLAGAR